MEPKNIIRYIETGIASAVVGNQPNFDGGGFPIRIIRNLSGDYRPWETLQDKATLEYIPGHRVHIHIDNIIHEKGVKALSTIPNKHTGGRVILKALEILNNKGVRLTGTFNLLIEKGLSIKGTGLGSSAASATATFAALNKILKNLGVFFSDIETNHILSYGDWGMIDNSIPSFYGGLVLVEKISQNIQTKTLPKNNKFGYFVIVTPHDFGIITEGARLILKGLIADDNDKIYCERMLKAFNKGNQKEYCHFMEKSHNWFVTPRINLYPNKGKAFTDVYNAAKNAGANGVTISGSGPTIIAFIDNVELADKVGDAMVNTLKKLGHPSQSRLVDIDSLGAR